MKAQLTQKFRDRVTQLDLPKSAIADMLGISRQQFSSIWNGVEGPSVSFILKAINAGLGQSFSDIAEPKTMKGQAAA